LDDQEDEDVIEERRRVLSGDLPSTAQVIVKNIEKEYDVYFFISISFNKKKKKKKNLFLFYFLRNKRVD